MSDDERFFDELESVLKAKISEHDWRRWVALWLEDDLMGTALRTARDLGYAAGRVAERGDEDLFVAHEELRAAEREAGLDRFHEAGWRIADDGDPYRPEAA